MKNKSRLRSLCNLKFTLFVCSTLFFNSVIAQHPVGIFDDHIDIGNPKIKGSASYDDKTQTYNLSGGGYNIWFNRDEFHYAYKKLTGDFILTADFEFTGDTVGAAGHRKIGWMIRESTDEAAAGITSCKHIDGLIVLQWRPYRGMFMRDPEDELFYSKKGGQTIQLQRIGKTVTMKIAHPGEPLQLVGSHEMKDMKDDVLAGIYILSHDSNQLAHAKVWNVRIDKPVFYPYTSNPHVVNIPGNDVFGSRLEILNVTDGSRQVIHEDKGRFEAPNWMPDGKRLIFNQGGSLYTIPVTGGVPEKLNTGSVKRNNNDHAISFDGKMLAISSRKDTARGSGSAVYTVPITGGEPKLITQETPSYLHGWNPNGKELAIVARRNGEKSFNIYKIDLKDGKETALTNNKTSHVDGPEYSPDGKYIYYNANVSGTMQVWRMKPDGSGKEQLTFDEYHNWFPHISPDGNSMVFISFAPDIDPDAHPSNKEVMLRVMKLTSPGAPRVVAHLFGGQGTMNVTSWSPDSKFLAFVSYSEKAK